MHGVWKSQKKSHSTWRAKSELRLHFEWTKVNQKCQKCSIWRVFQKTEACGQTVLPDMSVLIGQMPNFKNSNATFWVMFKQCGGAVAWINIVTPKIDNEKKSKVIFVCWGFSFNFGFWQTSFCLILVQLEVTKEYCCCCFSWIKLLHRNWVSSFLDLE